MQYLLMGLGFLTTVGGDLLTAINGTQYFVSNPAIAHDLKIAGLVILLAGVAKGSIEKWQATQNQHQATMLKLQESLKS